MQLPGVPAWERRARSACMALPPCLLTLHRSPPWAPCAQAFKASADALPAPEGDGSLPDPESQASNLAALKDTRTKLAAMTAALARLQGIRDGLADLQAAVGTDYVGDSASALTTVTTSATAITGTDVPAITGQLRAMQGAYDTAAPFMVTLLARIDHITAEVLALDDLAPDTQLLKDAKARAGIVGGHACISV